MTVERSLLRLVFVLDSLVSGGAQRQAVELACALQSMGRVEASFVVYHDLDFFGPRLSRAGIPVTRVVKQMRFDPTLPLRLRRWLEADRADVVHAFLPPPCLYAFLAVSLLSPRKRPVFVSGERNSLGPASSPGLWIERLVYPRSDAVTVNARPVASEIEARLRVDRRRIHYLPNGIDLAEWDRAASEPCAIDFELGVFNVALVGGLRSQKNHTVLLGALARLPAREREQLRIWFVGDETGAPGLAAKIRREISRLGLADLVRIVPAISGIASFMARLDALVLPSAFEGFPNVLLEAMASRLPTIASRVGDVPTMLENGIAGFLVEPGDAEALGDAVVRLRALAPTARREMGERARSIVVQRYRIEDVAARYLALYDALRAARAVRSGSRFP